MEPRTAAARQHVSQLQKLVLLLVLHLLLALNWRTSPDPVRNLENMSKGQEFCIVLVASLIMVALPVALISFAFALYGVTPPAPVQVTVEEASLGRLALVAPANGTASVAYNLSVAVSVRNPNLGKLVWRGAPLDAELRLAGNPFALVRLAGPETTDYIIPLRSQVYRVAAAATESAPVELDGDAVAAFARHSVVGMFQLELIVSGEFKYGRSDNRSITTTVSCRLRLPLSSSPPAVAFARFERTLPQPCTDVSDN